MSLVVLLVLEFFDDGLERLMVLAFALLHAEHDVAVHLDEAAVAVPGEAGVVGGASRGPSTDWSLRPRFRMVSIMPGIESRAPERTATSSGMPEVAPNLRAHDLLHVGDAGLHLSLQVSGIGASCGRSSRCRPRW
jgi:hypothetical protein